MRTALTIDPDIEDLNGSARASLGRGAAPAVVKPLFYCSFFAAPFPVLLKEQNFNHLADERDDEAPVEELSGL